METINLLNGKEFCPGISIMERLEEGAKSHSLIYTDNMRGIGKTSTLIEFAKKYGYSVIVRNESQAINFRKRFNYENIFGKLNIRGLRNLVIDEGVKLEDYISVITGFTEKNEIININKEDAYPGQVIESLRRDALKLSQRLAINIGDSDYKMLITNLKSTVESIQYLETRYKI